MCTPPPGPPPEPPSGKDGNCAGVCKGACSSKADGACAYFCADFSKPGPPNFGGHAPGKFEGNRLGLWVWRKGSRQYTGVGI